MSWPTKRMDTVSGRSDWFVALRRGARTALLAGPFASQAEAEALVDAAVALANAADPWSHFDVFGTLSMSAGGQWRGKFNAELGLTF